MYDQLTDLARMTFNCPTMGVALSVLKFLDGHAHFEIVRIKNRLMRAYDASPTGGYRDMLVNARFQRNKHVVEIQITLSPLLDIKMHGGHAVYKLARLLELNAQETTNVVTMPSKDVTQKIADGLVRNVTFRGVNVDESMRELLFSKAGLLSPSCAVVSLNFESITTDEVWPVAKVLTPQLLQQIGANLTTLMLNKCGLVGELTDLIARHCPNLEVLDLSRNRDLKGVIPENINRVKKLRELHIWGTGEKIYLWSYD